MPSEDTSTSNFFYPPGGILLWIIVFVELITFIMGLGAFVVQRSNNLQLFQESQQLLNPTLGIINTLLLVTGGFFMVVAVKQLKQESSATCLRNMALAIACGLSFLGVKGFEFYGKLQGGLNMGHNDFFMYYWLLTGFHFIHVLAAIFILLYLAIFVKKGYYTASNHDDVESGAVFWHMCDLIWLLIFPILYLL